MLAIAWCKRAPFEPLLIQRVQQHVEADAGGVLLGVATAADAFVAFECAADVVRREDDGPAAVDLDAFDLWFDLPTARGDRLSHHRRLAGSRSETCADVVTAVGGGEDRVASGDALEVLGRAARRQFRGGTVGERFAGTDRIGKQRAAAFEVFAELLAFGVGEVEVVAAVHEAM